MRGSPLALRSAFTLALGSRFRVSPLRHGDPSVHRVETAGRSRKDEDQEQPRGRSEPAVEPHPEEDKDQDRERELNADAGKFRPGDSWRGPVAAIAPDRIPAMAAPSPPVHAEQNLGACEIFRKQTAPAVKSVSTLPPRLLS